MNDTNDYLKVVKKALKYIDAQPLIEMPFDEAKEVMKLVEQVWGTKTFVSVTIALKEDLIEVVPNGGIYIEKDVIETVDNSKSFADIEEFKEAFYYPLLARKMVKNTKELIDSIPTWVRVDEIHTRAIFHSNDEDYSYLYYQDKYFRCNKVNQGIEQLINYNPNKDYHWTEVP